jgi:hypothetical protein
LVLPHIGGDVRVSILGHVPQSLNDFLRLDDQAVAVVVLHAVAAAPAFDGLPPLGQSLRVGLEAGLSDHAHQLGQHVFHIAHDRHIHLDALGDAGRVNVDVDDLAVYRSEMLGVADHAIVKPCTHGQQDVAVLHGVVGFERAVHAQHAQETAIGSGESAQAHQSVGDRHIEHVHQGTQFGAGVAQQHTTACVDVGALGRHQQLQGLANLTAVTLAHRVV